MSDPTPPAGTPPAAPAAAPTLRPLTVADLVDEIFRLYRRDFRVLFAVAAVVWLPASVALLVLNLIFFGGTVVPATFDPRVFGDLVTESIVALVVASVALPIVFSAITAAVAARHLERPITVGAAVRRGFACYGRVVLAYVLLIVVIVLVALVPFLVASALAFASSSAVVGVVLAVVALLVAVVAMIWATVTWAFIGQAIVIEDADVWRSFSRSRALVSGSRLRVLGINLLLTLVQVVLFTVPSTFVALLTAPFDTPIAGAVSQLASAVAQVLYFPVQLGALTLLYYDLRVRREGYDLTLAAEQLARA